MRRPAAPGVLRIISGDLRGRRIRLPRSPEVRPTGDRVREALFSMLGGSLLGLRVLDAYAGSGAFGLEAVSRGAHEALFVDPDREVLDTLKTNVAALGVAGRCRILPGRVETLVSEGRLGTFDLVFADPPWSLHAGSGLLDALARGRAVASGGRVVIERESSDGPAECDGFALIRTSRYGRTSLDFYAPGPVKAS